MATLTAGLHTHPLASIVQDRTSIEWAEVEDAQLPVPQHLVAQVAYDRFLRRGCAHGFDCQDWFDALDELRYEFRQLIQAMEPDPTRFDHFSEWTAVTMDKDPMHMKCRDGYTNVKVHNSDTYFDHQVKPGGFLQDGDAMNQTQRLHAWQDEFGTIWLKRPRKRSEMSVEEFREFFANCETVLVRIVDDMVVAGGSYESLPQSLSANDDVDETEFQREPGPFCESFLSEFNDDETART